MQQARFPLPHHLEWSATGIAEVRSLFRIYVAVTTASAQYALLKLDQANMLLVMLSRV